MRIAASPAKTSPKLPVGTTKTGGRAELRGGGEVIDALRRDAREIDRIDRGEMRSRWANSVSANSAFTMRLRVVEAAFERDVVDIGVTAPWSSGGAAPR